MQTMKCPACGRESMSREIVPNYQAKVGGLVVQVPQAELLKCSSCGEVVVGAEEMKRWQRIQQDRLRAEGHIPLPREVKEVREFFGLSVADFALLLGLTRQTIHAWEREAVGALQLGPAALLLGLL